MTIQRQYSLPNCTLALEGYGDASASGSDLRPVMSILTSAECRLMGQPVMRGGKDFFEGLIATASLYAQQVLSDVRVPAADEGNHAVHLDRVGPDQHQLIYKPESGDQQTLNLNTVQLFDLVEAIDQFIADNQTLPQREPISKQAVPFAAGLGSLAIAAAAFAAMPTPQIKQPNDLTFTAAATTTPAKQGTDPLVNPSPTPPAATPAASPTPSVTTKITDPEKLKQLSSTLEKQLQTNFNAGTPVAETVSYEVMLGQDGKILDYRPANAAAKDLVNQTPLPQLRYTPVPGSDAQEPVASFRAEFTPEGAVRVQPAGSPTSSVSPSSTASPSPSPETGNQCNRRRNPPTSPTRRTPTQALRSD
jgi:Domain of unknown function (DUF4335)